MSYHQTIVVGNIGSDPEMSYLPSGTAVTNFNVAVNEYWSDRDTGERREKTTWYRVACFGKLAEITHEYLSKGRQVMVIGTVEASAYIGNDGDARASLELRAQEVKFLQGGDNASGQQPQRPRQSQSDGLPAGNGNNGDIPF